MYSMLCCRHSLQVDGLLMCATVMLSIIVLLSWKIIHWLTSVIIVVHDCDIYLFSLRRRCRWDRTVEVFSFAVSIAYDLACWLAH